MSSSTSTLTSDSSNEEKKETAPAPFQVRKYDILSSKSARYMILDLNGEGAFGKVVKCLNLRTNTLLAIKIHKYSEDPFTQKEVEMLKAVRVLDPEKNNIVRFLDDFRFNSLSCLAFEMLDRSLFDLMKERKPVPLSLNEIRPVIHQLLIAFQALKGIGILHTDLKPDNIMLVNHKHQPFRVKLIDFGLALPVSELQDGMTIQAPSYRAPEVTLGIPLSEAVDMWGVGCIMAYLYFCGDLFCGNCAYHRMKAMVHMLGQPEDHVLNAGQKTWQYFSREENSISPRWRLKLPGEYEEATGVEPHVLWKFFDMANNLEDAVQSYSKKGDALEYEDRVAFLSLLKSCLHMDAGCRITPREALKHPFMTLVHLVDEMDISTYADQALNFMTVSLLQNLDESDDSDTEMELRDDQASDSGTDGVSGSCEESDTRALKTDLKRDPSIASVSLTDISGGEDSDTEGSMGQNDNVNLSSGEYDIEKTTSDSYDVDSVNPSSRNGDQGEPREPCFDFADVSAPTGLESGSPASSERHSVAEISSHENSTGLSGATDLDDAATATPTKEESSAAATHNDDNSDSDCVPVASNTNDDRVSAPAGSSDGTAACISSDDGAAAAIRPDDVDYVKKKKNLFQRTCKLFRRVKARVISIFKPRNN